MTGKTLLSTVLYISLCIYIYCDGNELSFTLSSEKSSYYEEEEVVLTLAIKNTSTEETRIDLKYLQPIEKKYIFVEKEPFGLLIEFNDVQVERFTNHIPPEPKPGTLSVTIKPVEEVIWRVPFPYYYYPFNLPGQFKIKLQYRDIISNEVVFNIQKSPGMTEGDSININPDFSQGKDHPYGWKLHNKNTVWDREHNQLVFHLDKTTAEGEGLWVYSLFYEIEPSRSSTEYCLNVKLKSPSPEVIIFIEGWKIVNGRRRRIERYECVIHPQTEWNEPVFNLSFKPEVRWLRIKVYAYLNAGDIYFKNVSLIKKK